MVRVPLKGVRIPGISRAGAKALLAVLVLSRLRTWEPLEFVMDTGSAVTTVPMSMALEKRLEVPSRSLEVEVSTASGLVKQRRRPGQLTVRIAGLEPREFNWPCHFVEHEGPPPKPALGLAGVLEDLRLIVDGAYREDAPHGTLTLEPTSPPSRRR